MAHPQLKPELQKRLRVRSLRFATIKVFKAENDDKNNEWDVGRRSFAACGCGRLRDVEKDPTIGGKRRHQPYRYASRRIDLHGACRTDRKPRKAGRSCVARTASVRGNRERCCRKGHRAQAAAGRSRGSLLRRLPRLREKNDAEG